MPPWPSGLQANLAIVNLDIVKTWLYGRDLSDCSCTQVKYPGYSETNQYNESEENAVPNKLNHSETILAIVKLAVRYI